MRILVLAFHFPPSGGGGVQRTLKHVKYLFREGIDATVIAAQAAFPLHDETLLDELPGSANVIRTEVLEFPEAQEAFAGVLRMAGLPPAPEARTLWPDVRAGWLVPAVSEGLRAIGAESPGVIYSTHPPATAHLIGLVLHRITRIPWVADFRDGWTLDPMFSGYGRSLPEFTAARRSLEETITSEATLRDGGRRQHGSAGPTATRRASGDDWQRRRSGGLPRRASEPTAARPVAPSPLSRRHFASCARRSQPVSGR